MAAELLAHGSQKPEGKWLLCPGFKALLQCQGNHRRRRVLHRHGPRDFGGVVAVFPEGGATFPIVRE